MSSFDAAERFRSRTLQATVTIATDPDLDEAVQAAAHTLQAVSAPQEGRRLSSVGPDEGQVEAARVQLQEAIDARDASGLTVHLTSRGQRTYVDAANQIRVNDLSLAHVQLEVARLSLDKITKDGVDTGLGWDDLDLHATGPEMEAIADAAVSLYRSADVDPFAKRGKTSAQS